MSALPSSWFTAVGSGTVVFPFITIDGDLLPTADRPERVIYPGTAGIGLWFDGERGEPFSINSLADFATQAAAFTAWGTYLAKVGEQMDLYYLGALWGSVVIHDVTLQSVRQCGATVGGVNVSSGSVSALLRASWKIETLV